MDAFEQNDAFQQNRASIGSRPLAQLLLATAITLLLADCSGGGEAARIRASRLAQQASFTPTSIAAGSFHLQAWLRLTAPSPVLRVYIEGDGHAWDTTTRPSGDPTPWLPVALELAAVDPGPAVAYLARPCQYVPPDSDPACTQSVWTDARYSAAVIASTNAALDQLKALAGASQLELVGFSGGGAVAALAGVQRRDLRNLRTVAANLDTASWTAEHHVTPLTGSLNPIDIAPRLAAVPQIHFVGGADHNVGLSVVRSFTAAEGSSRCIGILVVPGLEHDGDWPAVWLGLLSRPLPSGCSQTASAAIQ
ncbi:MAG TPA: alpha/beta hydrolase [Acetobacteraceae bacterium]|jgi:hypothetical protein|nr:alpha/beta hydrolase [Acetobacteraceae bacterium]